MMSALVEACVMFIGFDLMAGVASRALTIHRSARPGNCCDKSLRWPPELSCRQPLALTNASLRHAGVCQGCHPVGYRFG